MIDSRGSATLSENVEIVLGQDANITVVSLQEWDDDALHLASQFARLGHNAKLKHIIVSLGGGVVRVNPSAHLAEEGAEAELLGVYFADAGQHLEQRVYVHHDAPHTRSRVTYKGALNGAGARTVWVGDVLIGPAAVGTDTYEQNRNLVLSDGTRADSIPNLEIETGDILGAGHASATGRFDDEHLFYLQSRGITEREARRLVVLGFLSEIVQKIGEPELEARLQARARGGAGGIRDDRLLHLRARASSCPARAVRVVLDGVPIAVVRDAEGAVHALGDTCTHGDISLAEGFVEDDTIECWAHGSKFALATGKPLTLPAYEPVPVYAVEITDGAVYIDPEVTVSGQGEEATA